MSKNINIPEPILFISRMIVGLVFLFSGFVKGVDPMGFTYKLQDYFIAFNLDFLKSIALPLSILLILAEFLVGISLFFKLRTQLGAWGGIIFMLIFTPLTLVIALTDPVTDCGCFGDALVISNWQTFWKNLVIISFAILVFLGRNNYQPTCHSLTEWSILAAFVVFMLGINIYGLQHLPLIDFRPYKVGASISEGMVMPEDAPQDEYETILIYEKNGVRKEFTEENFPWQDSSWKFIDQNSFLIKEGYKPLLHDFNIFSGEGEELTDLFLAYPEYTFLLISQEIAKTSKEGIQKANELALFCNQNHIPFYCVTASGEEELNILRNEMELYFDFYAMDETTLKTIIRSDPALVLLKEGVIIGKLAWRDFPEPELITKNMLSIQLTSINHDKNSWRIFAIFLGILLLWASSRIFIKNQH